MTLQEKQEKLAEEINAMGDCLDQYSYLVYRSGALPALPKEDKTETNLVRGCQSIVWAKISVTNGVVHFQADSETLIIKGVLAVLADLVDGTAAAEITETPIDIFERTELAVSFESERLGGIRSILQKIMQTAKEATENKGLDIEENMERKV